MDSNTSIDLHTLMRKFQRQGVLTKPLKKTEKDYDNSWKANIALLQLNNADYQRYVDNKNKYQREAAQQIDDYFAGIANRGTFKFKNPVTDTFGGGGGDSGSNTQSTKDYYKGDAGLVKVKYKFHKVNDVRRKIIGGSGGGSGGGAGDSGDGTRKIQTKMPFHFEDYDLTWLNGEKATRSKYPAYDMQQLFGSADRMRDIENSTKKLKEFEAVIESIGKAAAGVKDRNRMFETTMRTGDRFNKLNRYFAAGQDPLYDSPNKEVRKEKLKRYLGSIGYEMDFDDTQRNRDNLREAIKRKQVVRRKSRAFRSFDDEYQSYRAPTKYEIDLEKKQMRYIANRYHYLLRDSDFDEDGTINAARARRRMVRAGFGRFKEGTFKQGYLGGAFGDANDPTNFTFNKERHTGIETVGSVFGGVLKGVGTVFKVVGTVFSVVGKIVTTVGSVVIGVFKTVFNLLQGIGKLILGTISGLFKLLTGAIKILIGGVSTIIKGVNQINNWAKENYNSSYGNEQRIFAGLGANTMMSNRVYDIALGVQQGTTTRFSQEAFERYEQAVVEGKLGDLFKTAILNNISETYFVARKNQGLNLLETFAELTKRYRKDPYMLGMISQEIQNILPNGGLQMVDTLVRYNEVTNTPFKGMYKQLTGDLENRYPKGYLEQLEGKQIEQRGIFGQQDLRQLIAKSSIATLWNELLGIVIGEWQTQGIEAFDTAVHKEDFGYVWDWFFGSLKRNLDKFNIEGTFNLGQRILKILNLESLVKNVKGIWESLKAIWNDPAVQEGIELFKSTMRLAFAYVKLEAFKAFSWLGENIGKIVTKTWDFIKDTFDKMGLPSWKGFKYGWEWNTPIANELYGYFDPFNPLGGSRKHFEEDWAENKPEMRALTFFNGLLKDLKEDENSDTYKRAKQMLDNSYNRSRNRGFKGDEETYLTRISDFVKKYDFNPKNNFLNQYALEDLGLWTLFNATSEEFSSIMAGQTSSLKLIDENLEKLIDNNRVDFDKLQGDVEEIKKSVLQQATDYYEHHIIIINNDVDVTAKLDSKDIPVKEKVVTKTQFTKKGITVDNVEANPARGAR